MGFLSKLMGGVPKPPLDLPKLATRREAAWRMLGTPDENVVSRLVPGPVAWPNSVLGKMRLIDRPDEVLLFTEGLSDPYDAELHKEPPTSPLEYELGISIARTDAAALDHASAAASLWPKLLYALADTVTAEWVDLLGLLKKFGCITYQAPIGHGFGQGYERDGWVGYLLGMPLEGADFNRQLYVNKFWAGLPTPYANGSLGLFPVKVLQPSELAWAIAQGNDGGMLLAKEFVARGEGCRNDATLPAIH
jgi:hypothetical protein